MAEAHPRDMVQVQLRQARPIGSDTTNLAARARARVASRGQRVPADPVPLQPALQSPEPLDVVPLVAEVQSRLRVATGAVLADPAYRYAIEQVRLALRQREDHRLHEVLLDDALARGDSAAASFHLRRARVAAVRQLEARGVIGWVRLTETVAEYPGRIMLLLGIVIGLVYHGRRLWRDLASMRKSQTGAGA